MSKSNDLEAAMTNHHKAVADAARAVDAELERDCVALDMLRETADNWHNARMDALDAGYVEVLVSKKSLKALRLANTGDPMALKDYRVVRQFTNDLVGLLNPKETP